MATLLANIQEVCRRLAQPVPSTVYGSTDKQVTQMMSLLQEGLDDLSNRGAWQELTNEYTWTTLGTEDQGSLTGTGLGSAPTALNGYNWLLPETLWDRTNKLPLLGAVSPQAWQALQAVVVTGPRFQFRIRQNKFLVNPAPTAGYTWAFEYVSKNYLEISSGSGTYTDRFTADANVVLLPDKVVQLDLRWRWKKEKGLPYAEDFNSLEAMVKDILGRNAGPKTLCLDHQNYDAKPGIFVPVGSWPL